MRVAWMVLAAAVVAAPAVARTPEETAAAALKAAPVWDGHNDVPEQLRARYRDVLAEFDFADTRNARTTAQISGPMHTDVARLRQGHVGAQFWSVYVDSGLPEPEAVTQTLEQIDVLKRLVSRYPGDLQLVTTARGVERAMKRGKIASLIGVEGGHSIAGSLGVLRQFYALGARYMTLTHYRTLAWADSADDLPTNHGLTPFGEQVVREMNRMGMIVDLAHVNEDTMSDALDVSKAPLIFSHSSARAVDGDSRNVPDAILRRVAANGGLVMVTALPNFTSQAQFAWLADRAGEEARQKYLWQGQPDKVAEAIKAWEDGHPKPEATVAQIADHIDHIRQVAGIDHIGIGGDFDGMPGGPKGMEDVSGYPALFVELARRGYAQADLQKIASGNMLRVMRAVEAYAAAHRSEPPIEMPVSG